MKILSLDLSTKSTGWAVFEDTQLIDSGCVTAASTDVINRIQKIIKVLEKVSSDFNIETIVVEEVRPEDASGNLHTHKVLMWMQAALAFMIHDTMPKATIEYTYPSEWRKACGIRTGRGIKRDALKNADIQFVKDVYNKVVNDDEADAIGIGHAYVNKLNNEINWE